MDFIEEKTLRPFLYLIITVVFAKQEVPSQDFIKKYFFMLI